MCVHLHGLWSIAIWYGDTELSVGSVPNKLSASHYKLCCQIRRIQRVVNLQQWEVLQTNVSLNYYIIIDVFFLLEWNVWSKADIMRFPHKVIKKVTVAMSSQGAPVFCAAFRLSPFEQIEFKVESYTATRRTYTVKPLKLDTPISWTPLYVEQVSLEPVKNLYFYMSTILFILDTPLSWNLDIPFVISWTGSFSQLWFLREKCSAPALCSEFLTDE
jgi:hypothetical protein